MSWSRRPVLAGPWKRAISRYGLPPRSWTPIQPLGDSWPSTLSSSSSQQSLPIWMVAAVTNHRRAPFRVFLRRIAQEVVLRTVAPTRRARTPASCSRAVRPHHRRWTRWKCRSSSQQHARFRFTLIVRSDLIARHQVHCGLATLFRRQAVTRATEKHTGGSGADQAPVGEFL